MPVVSEVIKKLASKHRDRTDLDRQENELVKGLYRRPCSRRLRRLMPMVLPQFKSKQLCQLHFISCFSVVLLTVLLCFVYIYKYFLCYWIDKKERVRLLTRMVSIGRATRIHIIKIIPKIFITEIRTEYD